jgi:hypothetical protein
MTTTLSRDLWDKLRAPIRYGLMGLMIGLFCFGMWKFPDAPIHPCGDGKYCGKQGQPHTYKDYESYNLWNTTMLYLWPIGMGCLILLRSKKDAKTDPWQTLSPEQRYKILHGPDLNYEKIRATYETKKD